MLLLSHIQYLKSKYQYFQFLNGRKEEAGEWRHNVQCTIFTIITVKCIQTWPGLNIWFISDLKLYQTILYTVKYSLHWRKWSNPLQNRNSAAELLFVYSGRLQWNHVALVSCMFVRHEETRAEELGKLNFVTPITTGLHSSVMT